MHRYRATHTAAPDSAYKMLLERTTAEERASWDLSSLQVLASAAEPIRPGTVDQLLEALAPCGFDPRAFCPCYGLAEHTVGVSVRGKLRARLSRSKLEREGVIADPRGEEAVVELFGCGPPQMGIEVRIVDPERRIAMPADRVGEIWLDSPSKCAGYYGRSEESRAIFEAELIGSPGRWLRTGDLGALINGEIVVTGRLKDMVILLGRNIYPQDVEDLVSEAHEQIRPGRVACFGRSTDEGQEEMIVVAELQAAAPTELDLTAISRAIRAIVRQQLQLGSFTLVLARRGSVPRTTSGKLRRAACRAAWLRDELEYNRVDHGLGGGGPPREAS